MMLRSEVCDREFRKLLSPELESVDSNSYVLRARVDGFLHRPGQYVALSVSGIPERFFSVLSCTKSEPDSKYEVLELLISFKDVSSPSYQIIQETLSGNEIFISKPLGHAYWRDSGYGNVLIACDSGYSYVSGIIGHIRNFYSEQPTCLFLIKDPDSDFQALMKKSGISPDFPDMGFSIMNSHFHRRDGHFIQTLLGKISQDHFEKSNFYVGSGRKFFHELKDALISAGVAEERIISDNH